MLNTSFQMRPVQIQTSRPVRFGSDAPQQPREVTDADFNQKVLQTTGVVIVRGYRSREGAEKAFASVQDIYQDMAEVARAQSLSAAVYVVNMDTNPETAKALRKIACTDSSCVTYLNGEVLAASG